MSDLPPERPAARARASGRAHRRPSRERGSSMVEYVGLGAISATLVSGVAAAIDSAAGDRLGAAIARRLLDAITGAP